MSEVPRNRRVTYGQMEQLWEFLNKNKSLATGFNKTLQAREFSRRMWEEIAQNLNSHGDGATKDGKTWCKYWNDYKSKLKKSVAAVRASHQLTGGGPSNVKSLTDIEQKFLTILGEDFGTGLPGIRVEPFERESIEHLPDPAIPLSRGTLPQSQSTQNPIETPIFNIARDVNVEDVREFYFPELLEPNEPQPSPSSRMTPPITPQIEQLLRSPDTRPPPSASPHTPHPSPRVVAAGAEAARSTTQPTSPRRRRQRRTVRREPPMSQEAARRALVEISNRRAETEEQNTRLLAQLVAEIRQIKEILLERGAGLPRVCE